MGMHFEGFLYSAALQVRGARGCGVEGKVADELLMQPARGVWIYSHSTSRKLAANT
jgi:hypothetical protein